MLAYDICYVGSGNALACTLTAQCADDRRACILAHAMRPNACKGIEVWRDEVLIYARPYREPKMLFKFERRALDSNTNFLRDNGIAGASTSP
jgi:hypothetical protein